MPGRKTFSIPLAAVVGLLIGCDDGGGLQDMHAASADDVRPPGDFDGDGTLDGFDNCPVEANADQSDVDADGVGDVCDDCPTVANPEQSDSDEDGRPDDCEEADADDPEGGPGGDGGPDGLNLPEVPARWVEPAPPIT